MSLAPPAALLAILERFDLYEGDDYAIMRRDGWRTVVVSLVSDGDGEKVVERMKADGWTAETVTEVLP